MQFTNIKFSVVTVLLEATWSLAFTGIYHGSVHHFLLDLGLYIDSVYFLQGLYAYIYISSQSIALYTCRPIATQSQVECDIWCPVSLFLYSFFVIDVYFNPASMISIVLNVCPAVLLACMSSGSLDFCSI